MARSIVLRCALTGAMAALVLCALPAQAQWKWRDAAGHVQYSDLPPPSGTPEKDILGRPAAQQRRAAAAAQRRHVCTLPSTSAYGRAQKRPFQLYRRPAARPRRGRGGRHRTSGPTLPRGRASTLRTARNTM